MARGGLQGIAVWTSRGAENRFVRRHSSSAATNSIIVCWLEFGGEINSKFAPGWYDVLWRLRMPDQAATDFLCDWSATVIRADGTIASNVEWKTEKKDPFWKPAVARGWFLVKVGSIHVESADQVVRVRAIGGNQWWFNSLKIDYVTLRPVAQWALQNRDLEFDGDACDPDEVQEDSEDDEYFAEDADSVCSDSE